MTSYVCIQFCCLFVCWILFVWWKSSNQQQEKQKKKHKKMNVCMLRTTQLFILSSWGSFGKDHLLSKDWPTIKDECRPPIWPDNDDKDTDNDDDYNKHILHHCNVIDVSDVLFDVAYIHWVVSAGNPCVIKH